MLIPQASSVTDIGYLRRFLSRRQKLLVIAPIAQTTMARSSFSTAFAVVFAVLLIGGAHAQIHDQCMNYFGGLGGQDGITAVRRCSMSGLKSLYCSDFAIASVTLFPDAPCLCPGCLDLQLVPTCKQGLRGFRGCCSEVSRGWCRWQLFGRLSACRDCHSHGGPAVTHCHYSQHNSMTSSTLPKTLIQHSTARQAPPSTINKS